MSDDSFNRKETSSASPSRRASARVKEEAEGDSVGNTSTPPVAKQVRFRDRTVPESSLGLKGRMGAKARGARDSTKNQPPQPPPTITQPPSAYVMDVENDGLEAEVASEPAVSADPLDEDVSQASARPSAKPSIAIPSSASIIGTFEDDLDELDPGFQDRAEDLKRNEFQLTELQKMTMPQLIATARTEGLEEFMGLKKQDLLAYLAWLNDCRFEAIRQVELLRIQFNGKVAATNLIERHPF